MMIGAVFTSGGIYFLFSSEMQSLLLLTSQSELITLMVPCKVHLFCVYIT